jgi:cobaltochelatase CobS
MTKTMSIVNGWGDGLDPTDIQELADLAYRMKTEVVHAANEVGEVIDQQVVWHHVLDFMFRIGPIFKARGDSKLDTKERRDGMRRLADDVNNKMNPPPAGPIKIYDPRFVSTGFATIRNSLYYDNLKVFITGVVNPQWVASLQKAFDNDELNRTFQARTEEISNILKSVELVFNRLVVVPSTAHALELEFDDDWEYLNAIDKGAAVAPTPAADTTTAKANTTSEGTKPMSELVSNAAVADAIKSNKFTNLDSTVEGLLNNLLTTLGLPAAKEIGGALTELSEKASRAATAASVAVTVGEGMSYSPTTTGTIPSGKATSRKASELFGLTGAAAKPFDINVPYYEWDGPHPYVPAVDPSYQFQPQQLLAILVSLITNQRTWLYGDTGCGKTTVLEQVAARLNYPVVRVNFDSEITRMDLIGAKDIIVSGGHPITTFTEGVLPMAMQMPCIFLADELDFIRADVAYVFQRALEGNGLTLLEDGGRVVNPHPGFRIFATANTQGQGDETGRYQGAKPQSAAFLDRFTMWIGCDYMNDTQVKGMLAKKYPALPTKIVDTLAGYAREHWTAFKNGQVLTALSPRGLLSCAMTYTVYSTVVDDKKAITQAMTSTFIDRASREDAQTIKGLIARVAS